MPQLTWLIVGATFGFGEALVRQLLEKGDNVIATAAQKSRQLLDLELAGATVVELDMSQSMYYLSRKLDDLLPIYDGLDVLVINRDFRVTTSGRRLRSVQVIIEEIFHEDDRFIGLAGRYFNWIGSGVVIHTVSTSDELTRVLEDKDAKIKGSNASADTTQIQKRNKPLPSGIHFCSVAPGYIPYSTDEHNAAIATGFGLIFPPSFTNTSKKEQADAAELSPATSHEIIGTSTSTSNGGTRTALHKAYLAIMGGESSRASRERSPTSSDDSLSSRDEGASPSKVSPASSCEEPSGTAAKHMQPAALSYTEPRDALTYHMPTSTPTERSKSPLQPSPIPAVEAVSKEAHAPAKGTHVPPQTASFPPTSPNEDVGESFAIPAGIEGVTVLREQCLEKMAICRKWASRDEGKLPPGVAAMMRMFPAFGNIEGNDLRNLLLDD